MKKFKPILWLFLFGSLWGINEVVLGDTLYRTDTPSPAIILIVCALLLLAIARGMFNKPGSSTIIGTFAALFRLVNTAPSYCHLLGIFLLGLTFDMIASLLIRDKEKVTLRHSLTGAMSALGNNALFAIVITYIIRYEYWVVGGLPKVAHHIFVSGSISALWALFLVPLGFWIGQKGWIQAERRPQWSYAGTVIGSIALWILVRLLITEL